MADQQFQLEIESLFNKNQTIPRLKQEFVESGFEETLISLEIPVNFGLSLLAQMCLHKRASLPTLVGILRHYFQNDPDPSQACADMLLKAAECDLVDWEAVREEFVLVFDVSLDVREELERYQYPLPMVIHPKPVTTNRETGYLTIHNSIILRDNHHEEDVCLDHINLMNQTKYRLNMEVARMIHNSWKGLDKKKPNEEVEDFEKRVRAFEKYDKTSREIMEMLVISGNEFYLTHKYDKRGRCYCQGYHVNYQGNPWNKAVLEFYDGEVVE